MHLLVPIKRVVDYNVKIQVKSDGSGVNLEQVKMSMNPFDEIALEEAIRLKEQSIATKVIALTIGDNKCQDILRTALAMGATHAIHILHDGPLQPLTIAQTLLHIVKQENIQITLLGKQAIDSDNNQVAQMLAGLWNVSQATFASKIIIDKEQQNATVTREIDGGLMTVLCTLPTVISVDLRLNTPRYPTLPNIMKARSMPIQSLDLSSLNVSLTDQYRINQTTEPATKKKGKRLSSIAELIQELKTEGVL
jgi:electron transfer flavoprotein beta subunit